MNYLLIAYLTVSIISFVCILIGNKLLHPKNPLYVILVYLAFVVFFLGRLYEVARILLNLDIFNTFELGFIGIIGTFSFLLSSHSAISEEIKIKPSKSVNIKSLILSVLVGLMYLIVLVENVTLEERIIDLIVVIYACLNIYYFMKYILLCNEDKSNLLNKIKMYNIFGIIFSILVILLFISFALDVNLLILLVSILISIDLLLAMLSFKGVINNGS